MLLRTVFLPPGDAVQSVTWSNDERDALIATSGKVLALDTRTWRIESIARLAATAPMTQGHCAALTRRATRAPGAHAHCAAGALPE